MDALLPERSRRAHAARLENCFGQSRESAAENDFEWFGLRKDGSEFPAEIFLNPARTEDGAWAMCTIRDFTNQKHTEDEVKAKNAALEKANQELQAFSYSISHDLRAPLRAMDGFAGMLKKSLGTNLPKETEHSLKRIQENVTKMSRLIDGLLDFSTLSWVAVTSKTVNPGEIAKNAFNELAKSAAGRRVDFAVDKLPECKADAILLRQAFANLLSNALKFTRDRNPAVIRVGCIEENGETVYFVQDNGAGFDMEYAGKLFHVFQHLHSPSEFEGAGVGLAIVQRIIERHGGRIWVKAQTDRGATFYFTLGEKNHGHST
jgi:light-regulated signal transduction histidine kinase (bacteriophytochrome)